jgi:ABC-2 type transport system permease protein
VSPRRIAAIARQDLRILRTDPMAVVPLIVLPLVVMPFLQPAFRAAFHFAGLRRANGAEQVVPGMAVTFGFFLVMNTCSSFFREHTWQTWDRLRASPAGAVEIMLGKMITPLVEVTLQFVLLFGFAGLLMDLHVRGSWLELCAVGCAFALFLVTTGVALTGICRTYMQANAAVAAGALVMGGFAGALVPHALLPPWAQSVAPLVPSYWAMQGYKHAIFGGKTVLVPILLLLGFSLVSTIVAASRFRLDDPKIGPT